MPESFHKSCLVCNGSKIHPLRGYEIHDLSKCSDCGFVFMRKIPTSAELESYYSVYAYENEKEMSEPTRVSLESLVKGFDLYRQNNRILDVGCGEGWILEVAKKNGWDVYGTEYSARAIEICEAKGIKMYKGVLKPEEMQANEFDVIVSSETIEHINNPREDFSNICKLLRKGGLLYVATPNFNAYLRYMLKEKYYIIQYPGHLSYYTKKTLHNLLRTCGLKKVKLLTTGVSLTRFQNKINTVTSDPNTEVNADEKLRIKIIKSTGLQFVKKVVNKGLTFTGLGLTLKAYYIKK